MLIITLKEVGFLDSSSGSRGFKFLIKVKSSHSEVMMKFHQCLTEKKVMKSKCSQYSLNKLISLCSSVKGI